MIEGNCRDESAVPFFYYSIGQWGGRAQRRLWRMKRARRKAAARFSRPEGPGNRFAATRARVFPGSSRSSPPHPSRPLQAAPPSPQGEGGAGYCFRLPFIRRWRWLLLGNGAPGSSRPTESTPPTAIVPPSTCPPVFHFSFPPKNMLDILPPTVYKCTNTINTLYRGTKNQPKKEAER